MQTDTTTKLNTFCYCHIAKVLYDIFFFNKDYEHKYQIQYVSIIENYYLLAIQNNYIYAYYLIGNFYKNICHNYYIEKALGLSLSDDNFYYKLAIKYYELHIEYTNSYVTIETLADFYYQTMPDYENAIIYYKILFDNGKINNNMLLKLATSYWLISDNETAIVYYKILYNNDTNNINAVNDLARCYMELNDIDNAIYYGTLNIELATANGNTECNLYPIINLADFYAKINDTDNEFKYRKMAVYDNNCDFNGKCSNICCNCIICNGDAMTELAKCYMRKTDFNNAVKHYKKGIRYGSRNIYDFAKYLEDNGKLKSALHYYKKSCISEYNSFDRFKSIHWCIDHFIETKNIKNAIKHCLYLLEICWSCYDNTCFYDDETELPFSPKILEYYLKIMQFPKQHNKCRQQFIEANPIIQEFENKMNSGTVVSLCPVCLEENKLHIQFSGCCHTVCTHCYVATDAKCYYKCASQT